MTKKKPELTLDDKTEETNQEPDTEHTRRISRQLACQMSDEETLGKVKNLMQLMSQREQKEREKSMMSKQFKAEIEVIEGKVRDLREMLEAGAEVRLVDIEETFNWDGGTVTQVRLDTMENIGQRPIEQWERQTPIFDPEQDVDQDADESDAQEE